MGGRWRIRQDLTDATAGPDFLVGDGGKSLDTSKNQFILKVIPLNFFGPGVFGKQVTPTLHEILLGEMIFTIPTGFSGETAIRFDQEVPGANGKDFTIRTGSTADKFYRIDAELSAGGSVIRATDVPEPSILVLTLIGTGTIGLVHFVRRRSKFRTPGGN